MRYFVFIAVIAATAAGCATMRAAATRSTEEMLAAAGFHMEAADTPEKLAELQALPPRRVRPQTRDGQPAWVYPDPNVCHCLYVGGDGEYQAYERLRLQQDIADQESSAAMNWGYWTPWPWWP